MLKYKKAIQSAMLLLFFTVVNTMFLKLGEIQESSFFVNMMMNYSFDFFYTIVLFVNLYNDMDDSIIICRFNTIEQYYKKSILEKIKQYTVLFGLIVIMQGCFFYFVDSNFIITTFVYRNIVLYVLINVVNILVQIGNHKKKFKKILVLFLIWIIFYFVAVLVPESHLNLINIFTLLYGIHLKEIIRYSMMLLLIMLIEVWRIINKEKRMKKWLD